MLCVRCKTRETNAPPGFRAPICEVCHAERPATMEELTASLNESLAEATAKATHVGTVACPLCGVFVENDLDGSIAFCSNHSPEDMAKFALEHRDYVQVPVDVRENKAPTKS